MIEQPVLHLSGRKLRGALEALISAAESVGGIERMALAVRLKATLFHDRLGQGRAATVDRSSFTELAQAMPTVRRRIGALIEQQGWIEVRNAISVLLQDAHVPDTADQRIAAFERALRANDRPSPASAIESSGAQSQPRGRDRFIRDLAAELLHAVYPEHHPLMTRWVWDAKANSGVLREIWHDTASGSDDVDRVVIDIADIHATFLGLREELSQFLSENGIFRDMLGYVDLLCAHIYGDYINAQGGAYLKTDFNAGAADPLEHTRRILGLDRRGLEGRDAGLRAQAEIDSAPNSRGAGGLPAKH